MTEEPRADYILTLTCPDQRGIVHAVASFLLVTGCSIVDSQQYGDPDTGVFFMRVHFRAQEPGVDLVVLARYMQILSPELCGALEGRAINIHHSFLPSFKGAKPYYQAHDRGVKLIGATAHYVTADLDEGPIIEQDVERVDHTSTPEDFTAIGRDVECVVLARAVRWHVEHRVLRNGRKTVVFD